MTWFENFPKLTMNRAPARALANYSPAIYVFLWWNLSLRIPVIYTRFRRVVQVDFAVDSASESKNHPQVARA